jgi:Protein of unknown function (DUF3617)
MTTRSFGRTRLVATFVLLFSIPVLAADEGDQWEVTTKMTVEGMDMNMGGQTHTVCSPKEWNEPPGGASGPGGECTVTDAKRDGSKYTWKVSCAGPPAMTGVGEIVRDGDSAYDGTIRFDMDGGAMVVKIKGRRLGSCTVAQ